MAAKDLYEKDFYKVLGVDKKAPADEIKKKYRSLARDLHPDKTKGDVAKEEQFKAVSEAYEILSDAKKRAEYDEARSLFEKAASVHHKAAVSKVEILEIFLVAEIRKISFQTSLVAADVVVHVRDKIFKQKQLLPFANQSSEQHLIFV